MPVHAAPPPPRRHAQRGDHGEPRPIPLAENTNAAQTHPLAAVIPSYRARCDKKAASHKGVIPRSARNMPELHNGVHENRV